MEKNKKLKLPVTLIHYARTITPENLSKASNIVGKLVLTGLGKFGQFFNNLITSGATTDFGLTSPFVMSSMEERKAIQKGKQLAKEKTNEKIAEGMTWVSPLNYGAALWNGHGLNAKEGEKEVASWSPAWLAVGRVGELYLTPKVIKGAKNTPATINSVTKTIKTKVRDHKITKAFDELIDKGIRPNLYLRDLMYRVTTPKEVSALNSGDFVIKPSAENHGVYGWRVGAPFYKPGSHVESVMVGRRNSSGGTSTPIHNPVYLTAPVSDNLYVRLGSGGRYGRQVLSTRVHPGGKHDYLPSGGLYFPEESSIAFLVGDVIPQNITAWRRHNGVWGYEDVTPVLQYGPYRTPVYDILPMVYRTSAKEYFNWMKGENPKVSLNDSNAAFIELRSHPEGHATVATRHLKDANGRDITFTFDESPKDNLLQLEFDDSHGPSVLTLDADLISQNVKAGNWKGSEIAEEVKRGTPRESVTFKNITPELADLVIEFIEKNSGKNIYVHCLRGSSRSGAFDKFLEDYYGYGRPQGKNVNAASPEVYNALVKAYERKHPVLKHKQGSKMNTIEFLLKGKNIIELKRLNSTTIEETYPDGTKKRVVSEIPLQQSYPEFAALLASRLGSSFGIGGLPSLMYKLYKHRKDNLPLMYGSFDLGKKKSFSNTLNEPLPLPIRILDALPFMKNGNKIHIKKKNRGKFTSYCGGKVTDSCIRRAKASGNPTLVKRATFAANARKWKH